MWNPGGEGGWPLGEKNASETGDCRGRKKRGKGVQDAMDVVESATTAVGGGSRDKVLTIFHALGKVLYNKRLPVAPEGAGTRALSFFFFLFSVFEGADTNQPLSF